MTQASKTRVLISIPTEGWIHKHCVFALAKIMEDHRYQKKLILPTHRPYENNLNQIVKQFLDEEHDFWLNFDSDNPPRHNPLDLVSLNLDIIGCPTPVWANMKKGDYPIYWNALDKKDDGWAPHKQTSGLQEVDAIGSGCMLISRRVFLALKKPFMREWDDDGIVQRGHDYLFCERAKKAGFKVWAHYDYPCFHFNEIEIGEIAQAMESVYRG